MDNVIASGTGHRPDKLYYGYEGLDKDLIVLAELISSLLTFYKVKEVKSGMAQGFDTALALAAIHAKVYLTAIVPFPGYESRWSKDARDLFQKLLGHADNVKYSYSARPKSKGEAVGMLHGRNRELVHDTNLLFCLWNGSDGGTQNCIEYAKRYNKLQEPENRLVMIDLWRLYRIKLKFEET